jgi:hypothetical protein
VETMIAKTRRRMKTVGSKIVYSIPKETAAVPRASPAIPVEAAAVSEEPRIAKKAREIDEVNCNFIQNSKSNVFWLIFIADSGA